MPYSLFYKHRPYRMISIAVSPYCEMVRWHLDRLAVEYCEDSHVPVFHFLPLRFNGGVSDVPAVVTNEKTLINAREALAYFNARSPDREKLIPRGSEGTEVEALVNRFYDGTGVAVRRWAYWHMLPNRRVTLRTWMHAAPLWERLLAPLVFPILAKLMRGALNLTPEAPQAAMAEIDADFELVAQRLEDGRRYLVGDRLTAADLLFAALMAPALLPENYGGPMPALDETPPAMRAEILRLRATPAGQFALRIYREERDRHSPPVEQPGGLKRAWTQWVSAVSASPTVLRCAFGVLRRFRPIVVLGKTAIVAKHADVVDVLERDQEFTIAEINAARMERANAPFILGMDRSPAYDREAGILRRTLVPADLDRIRKLVAGHCAELIEAARPIGRIDVVTGLARVVATRVVADFFGTPGPTEQTMMRWMRFLFYDVFLNRSDDPFVSRVAHGYSVALKEYLEGLIGERKNEIRSGHAARDNFLTRLLEAQQGNEPSLDDDGVRRNISGIIVGAVDTTSAAVAQAFDQLLRRPQEQQAASRAALADDVETVSKYVFEALRFNPQTPGILRYCRSGAVLAASTRRERQVPPGTQVVLGTLSGMFDPDAFEEPGRFRVDRSAPAYLHFGTGMHSCYGRPINMVQIPEIIKALLRLKKVRRAAGSSGRIAYDGPFPDRLVVQFDP